jgi:hypothetical protein
MTHREGEVVDQEEYVRIINKIINNRAEVIKLPNGIDINIEDLSEVIVNCMVKVLTSDRFRSFIKQAIKEGD